MCVSTSCYCGKDLGNKAVVVIVLEIMVHLMNRQYLNFIKGKIIQLRVKYTYALEGGGGGGTNTQGGDLENFRGVAILGLPLTLCVRKRNY